MHAHEQRPKLNKSILWWSRIHWDIIYYVSFSWGMLTPSPTWKSCQAVAIHICAEHSEGEKATTEEECERSKWGGDPAEKEWGAWERLERVKHWKPCGTIIQACSDFIKREIVKEVKRRKDNRGEMAEWARYTCHQGLVVSSPHTLIHPLIASISLA